MTLRFRKRRETGAISNSAVIRNGMRLPPGIVNKMLAAQKRERDIILSEFVKVRGLMPLLMKRRNGDIWTRAERMELQEHLRALAHLSPYLVVVILPGSFALLPVLAWWLDRRRILRGGVPPSTA